MKLSNKKLTLAIVCTLQLLGSTCVFAQGGLDDIDQESHARHYNKLTSPIEGEEKLKSSPHFDAFMKEAEEVVTRYEMEAHVGMRLIHKHFMAGDNQVIAEQYEVVEGIPSLVTKAHDLEEAKKIGALPASWIFSKSDKDPVMFEASADEEVKVGHQLLKQHPQFVTEMSQLLYKHELNDLLALSLLKRRTLVGTGDESYVEKITSNGSVSVVQLGNIQNDTGNFIRTSWSFKGPRKHVCGSVHFCIKKDGAHGGGGIHF